MKVSVLPRIARQRGVALMLVLFAIMFLAILVTGLWEGAQYSWDESTLERQRFEARLLAESGLAIALHPEVSAGDEVLRHQYPDGRSFSVLIGSEGGRLLINAVEEEVVGNAIRELMILWGLDATEASTAVDSLADWVDEDDEVRTNGAENSHYASRQYDQFPLNTGFTSLEQMLLVRGMDRVAQVQPDWRDYFTLYGEGSIDVNQASAEMIEAFFGATREAALNLVATRNGTDGLEGTEDDYQFEDLEEVKSLLGLTDETFETLTTWTTVANPVLRIESVGRVGDFALRLILLTDTTTEDDTVVLARLEER